MRQVELRWQVMIPWILHEKPNSQHSNSVHGADWARLSREHCKMDDLMRKPPARFALSIAFATGYPVVCPGLSPIAAHEARPKK